MNTIVIVVDEGGVVSEVYVPKDVADDVDVRVIDFCTDDPERDDEAKREYKEVIKNKALRQVY